MRWIENLNKIILGIDNWKKSWNTNLLNLDLLVQGNVHNLPIVDCKIWKLPKSEKKSNYKIEN